MQSLEEITLINLLSTWKEKELEAKRQQTRFEKELNELRRNKFSEKILKL